MFSADAAQFFQVHGGGLFHGEAIAVVSPGIGQGAAGGENEGLELLVADLVGVDPEFRQPDPLPGVFVQIERLGKAVTGLQALLVHLVAAHDEGAGGYTHHGHIQAVPRQIVVQCSRRFARGDFRTDRFHGDAIPLGLACGCLHLGRQAAGRIGVLAAGQERQGQQDGGECGSHGWYSDVIMERPWRNGNRRYRCGCAWRRRPGCTAERTGRSDRRNSRTRNRP